MYENVDEIDANISEEDAGGAKVTGEATSCGVILNSVRLPDDWNAPKDVDQNSPLRCSMQSL